MNTVRGLVVWLGAPLLASVLCTAAAHLVFGGDLSGWRQILGFSLLPLLFTLGGSALLTLAFGAMHAMPVNARYAALLALGVVAGGAWMLLIGGTSEATAMGAAYGAATACLWAGLHRTLFGSR